MRSAATRLLANAARYASSSLSSSVGDELSPALGAVADDAPPLTAAQLAALKALCLRHSKNFPGCTVPVRTASLVSYNWRGLEQLTARDDCGFLHSYLPRAALSRYSQKPTVTPTAICRHARGAEVWRVS